MPTKLFSSGTSGGGGGGSVAWGSITGTLSNQTDLQSALDAKLTNPMTTAGDTIYGGVAGAGTRLAKGTGLQLYRMNAGATAPEWFTFSGGDLSGPGSATDNAVTRFDGTTGKLVQNSGVTLDDNNVLRFATAGAATNRIQFVNAYIRSYPGDSDSIGIYATQFDVAPEGSDGTTSYATLVNGDTRFKQSGQNHYLGALTPNSTTQTLYVSDSLVFQVAKVAGAINAGGIDSAGIWTIGAASGTQIHVINGATYTAGTDVLTLTNGPTGSVGNPDIYLKVNINGTNYAVPGWAA